MGIVTRKLKMGLFLLFWAGLFWFVWKNMLVMETDGLYAGWVNVWGDWAAHLSYASSFGYGDNFPPEMPLLAGTRFSYPFLSDVLPAILMRLGIGLIPSMLVPSFLLSIVLLVMLVWIGKELTGSDRVGKLTSLLFLFNGGLGFWWWFKDLKVMGVIEGFKNFPREYTHLEKIDNIQWINIITSQVVPQRGFLMGFSLAILAYVFLWRYWNKKRQKNLKWAGLVTATLPLIHAHSFMIVIWVAGWLMVMEWISSKKLRLVLKRWLRFFLPVILLGIPQVMYFYGSSLGGDEFIRFKPGWMAYKDGSNVIWFWIKNLGLVSGLMLLGLKMVKKKLRWFSLPFFLLFLVANVWIFQPWEWDNTKFFTHWYLMGSVLGAVAIDKGFKQKKVWLKVMVVVVLGFSLLAGFLDTWRLTQYEHRKIRFFQNHELVLAEWVKENTDPRAVFLTSSDHDHWVPVLTGRKIILGFKGWLWTYGVDYSSQELLAKNMFEGLGEMRANYVVIGPREKRQEKNLNEKFFEDNFKMVYELKGTKIFSIDREFL